MRERREADTDVTAADADVGGIAANTDTASGGSDGGPE
jgi:hypothetical protein